ncbi:hypothetical protein [Nonomuraea candida]|uniref:hypothetical protein n=1 Tax=Nonomuraea candida TaxID=359159 RepID=UPI0005BBB3E3|nr:hypothetical protein [Nonomuraea candida]
MDKLDSSPFSGDLREELAVQPAQGASKLTLALGAGVVLVAGILIGIQAASWSAPADVPPQAAGAQRQPGGYGGQGGEAGYGRPDRQPGTGRQDGTGQPGGTGQQDGTGQPGGGAGATVGTVEKVEGGKVYVKTADGATVTVTTTDRTTVRVSKPGKVSDLEAGTTVVVRGQQGDDGAVAAASISQGGGQGFQGGGPR